MILAEVNTGRFQFVALGTTEEDAIEALRAGYARHADQSDGQADPALFAEMLEYGEVVCTPIEVGGCLRDGQPLTP